MSISQRLAGISDIINNKRHRGGGSSSLLGDGDRYGIDDDENDENQGVSHRIISSNNHSSNVVKRRRIIAETISPLRLMFVVQRTSSTTTDDLDNNPTTPVTTAGYGATTESAMPPPDTLDPTTVTAPSKPKNDVLEAPSTSVEAPNHEILIADTIAKDFVQYLKEQSQLVEEGNQKLMDQRSEIFQTQTRIWNTYLEGLSTISQLTDLRHAPDAIMPHNF